MTYGWGYLAQISLTLVLGVESFAVYIAATSLGMVGAYVSMAGVSDLLTRQWPWLVASKANFLATMARFVGPRLLLALVIPCLLAFTLERLNLITPSSDLPFWLIVGIFGLLAVVIDLLGGMLTCLGHPSVHVISSNGMLGIAFFAAAGWTFLDGKPRVDVVLFHITSQVLAIAIILCWLAPALRRALNNVSDTELEHTRPDLHLSAKVTLLHSLEILRAHLPVLLIQAMFHSTLTAAVIASMRFSRAADVMNNLALSQYTRAFVTGPRSDLPKLRSRTQYLCLVMTLIAMGPLAGVIYIICMREGVALSSTSLILGMIVASSLVRQATAIEIWMAKVLFDPGPALKAGLITEILRFSMVTLIAQLGGRLELAVAAMVLCDIVLLVAMLRLSRRSLSHD